MEIKIPEVPIVSIPSYSTDSEEVVWFTIQIKLKDREWTVNHRFNYGSRSLFYGLSLISDTLPVGGTHIPVIKNSLKPFKVNSMTYIKS